MKEVASVGEEVTEKVAHVEPEIGWNGHLWVRCMPVAGNFQFCKACGLVRRRDDKNRHCSGPVKIALRDGGKERGE